jgi:Peptidase family M41/AAA+ lid domain
VRQVANRDQHARSAVEGYGESTAGARFLKLLGYGEALGAGLTTGFTGADLANLVNEAAIMATRRSADAVTLADFTAAIERIVAGLEKMSRVLGPAEHRRVAYHELGDALVAASLPGVDPVHKVSIIPRGVGALGYTMQRPTEDRFVLARHDLANRIAVLTGSRSWGLQPAASKPPRRPSARSTWRCATSSRRPSSRRLPSCAHGAPISMKAAACCLPRRR